MSKPRKLVHIVFYDAAFLSADWRNVKQLKPGRGVMVESAGFLVKQTKKGVYLATDLDPDERGRYRYTAFVPRGMIKKMKVVKV